MHTLFRGPYLVLLAITLLMGVIGFAVNDIPRRQMKQGEWVIHTYKVIGLLDLANDQLTQAKLARADFEVIFTVNELSEYHRALSRTQQSLGMVQQKALDPIVLQKLAAARQFLQGHLTYLDQQIRSAKGPELRIAESMADEDQKLATAIAEIRKREDDLLRERTEKWQSALHRTRLFFIGGLACIYFFIIFAYMLSRKEAKVQERLLEIEAEMTASHRNMSAHMTQMFEVQQEIASHRLNLENALEIISRRTQQITRADGAVIELLDGEEMEYHAGSGSMASFDGFRVKVEGSLTGLAMKTQSALRSDDTELDDRVDKTACRKIGIRSMIVVPLIQGKDAVGVLKVASSRPRAFTADDLSTLQMMSGVLSATLRDAKTADELQDSNMSLSMTNAMLSNQKTQLEADNYKLQTRADSDSMTGLKNHRYFQEFLEQELIRAKRYKNAASVMLVDVDHFKAYNDQFGHPAGDAALKRIASILKDCGRPSDCVARYGGEEFVLVLPQTPPQGALIVAERIREAIQNTPWENRQMSVSIGIAGIENGEDIQSAELIDRADRALYRSKSEGRNRSTPFNNAML